MSGLIDRRSHTRGAPSPLVEAVTKHPGNWSINDQDWGGSTNNQDHEMWVPLNDDACTYCGESHGDMIRSHELMHTKLSPETFGPVTVQVGNDEIPVSAALVEVAEEYRINYSLARIEGTTLVESGWCSPAIEPGVHGVMDQGKFTEVIKLAVAGGPGADSLVRDHLSSYYSSLSEALGDASTSEATKTQLKKKQKVTEALLDAIPAYSAAAHRIMGRKVRRMTLPSWSKVEELAAFLEINLKEFNRQLRDLLTDPPPDLELLDRALARWGESVDQPSLMPKEEVEKDGVKVKLSEKKSGGVEAVRWGKPEIVEAVMPLKLAAWKLQKANRAVDEGTIPRYMHRWPTDKRVFHRSKKLPGGALLIDDSGSMGFTSEDLEAIIEAAPMATVALYAGSGETGEIRVVAKDGKRAKTEDLSITYFGGNEIDGAALEWLGTQPYPRVWVTDGGVIDLTFGHAWQSIEACRQLCLKHRVTVVETAEEAAKLMKSGNFAR